MAWLRRIGIGLIVLVVIGAGAYWYEVVDGSVPATSAYKTDIAGWRQLVARDSAELPSEIRVDFVGRDTMPFAAVQAGGANVDFARTRAAFQIIGRTGSTIIDSTMDRGDATKAQRGDKQSFDAEAYGRVISAMGVAAHVAVTHEHMDHIGGVIKFPMPERLAPALILTKQQFEGLALGKISVPPAYASIAHLDLTAPTRIAPGIVMIPAPGHTIGSAMFYVRLADGHEVLFIGDIAWAISNVRDAVMRPRFVEQFFMTGENRAQVADQIRALHDLAQAEPAVTIIPAHDDKYLSELVVSGLLKPQFFIDGP